MSPLRMRRHNTDGSESSMSSHSSNASNYTRSTAITTYDLPSRPSLRHHQSGPPRFDDWEYQTSPSGSTYDPRDSTSTYASTVPSDEDVPEDEAPYDVPPEYETDHRQFITQQYQAKPSTPPEFAELFPSTRSLQIRHDDTIDGNMNLRIDTLVPAAYGTYNDVTLFHLRMHDLKSREFSLRRYCRESGREVCHSHKVTKQQAQIRPTLQRSVGSMLSSFRGNRTDSKHISPSSNNLSGIRRHDSGYDSFDDGENDDDADAGADAIASANLESASTSSPRPDIADKTTKITKLEFTNYAQVDVQRLGSGASKRYEFEYWGANYIWRRTVKKTESRRQISYHLTNSKSGKTIAHIIPEELTSGQAAEEKSKGGWIPPCSMQINDASILSGLTDVADVIVATGLIALVDDSIAQRFHTKKTVQITVPVPMKASKKLNMEYVGPKRLIDEVFSRRHSGQARHPTPLRQISAEA